MRKPCRRRHYRPKRIHKGIEYMMRRYASFQAASKQQLKRKAILALCAGRIASMDAQREAADQQPGAGKLSGFLRWTSDARPRRQLHIAH